MQRIAVVAHSKEGQNSLQRQLARVGDIEFLLLDEALRSDRPGGSTVFDLDLEGDAPFVDLRDWLKRRPANAKAIFITDRTSHLQHTRAYALGATDVVHRPFDGRTLLAALWGDVSSLAAATTNPAIQKSPAVVKAVDTLKNIFSSACLGAPLNPTEVKSSGDTVITHVEAQGLTAWIDTVRTHHSSTYQHCLLVTGLAVAFGQQIGVSRNDRQRLSFAGMLHDIGKARIPLAILEKPGRLDDTELAAMKKHPLYGFDALGTVPELPAEMLDMVVHHHEYLDGSGYPHGLQANEISDLVRMITIADVFGALIERRSYKPPLSGTEAYQILLDMGPKLDRDLVRAFKPVAQLGTRGQPANER
jgi:HD-GYP domain-containing protein (c-di-GMP phosphodiesterase class II)